MQELHRAVQVITRTFLACMLMAIPILTGCSPASEDPPQPAANVAQPISGDTINTPATAPAGSESCCSCAASSGDTFTDRRLPCLFDPPVKWEGLAGDDGALVSAVLGPPTCSASCPQGEPGMSVSFGTKPDSNADTMESIWRQAMPIAGDARCGDGTVTFFSPPGADPGGLLGGVKFYVSIEGKKYSGAANFSCGVPGGWLELQRLFIDSFRDNPDSSFPGR